MTIRLAVLTGILAAGLSPASADWIDDMMITECSDTSRDRLAVSTRERIESSVRRAEASIEPPAAIGDLGCLDGLMGIDIDVFAPVGPLSQLFSGSFDGSLSPTSPSPRFCRFARQKWNEVTRPLAKSLKLIGPGLPPDFAGVFNDVADVVTGIRPPPAGSGMDPESGQVPGGSGRAAGSPGNAVAPVGRARPATPLRNPDSIQDIWSLLYGTGN